jgi:hypothetical protein
VNLDDDLAVWAATVRLPDADADAIFQRIVAAPGGPSVAPPAAAPTAGAPPAAAPKLKPSWWRGYNAGFAARMVASTAPIRLAA